MKALFDLLPVIAFFAVYYLSDKNFMIATATLLVVTVAQLIIVWIRQKKIEKIPLYSAILVVFLGGVTLLFNDPEFLQWKPTVLYWLLGCILLVGQILGTNLTRKALTSMYEKSGMNLEAVPQKIWGRLNLLATVFLAVIGAANIYVAYHFSQEFWVNFKLFGLTALTLVIMLILTLSLAPYMSEDKTKKEES